MASGTEDGTGALGLGHDGTQELGGGVLLLDALGRREGRRLCD